MAPLFLPDEPFYSTPHYYRNMTLNVIQCLFMCHARVAILTELQREIC